MRGQVIARENGRSCGREPEQMGEATSGRFWGLSEFQKTKSHAGTRAAMGAGSVLGAGPADAEDGL
jgi:hypothetical protein